MKESLGIEDISDMGALKKENNVQGGHMMRKYDKVLSGILATVFLASTFGNYNVPVYAQDTEEKPYVIVTEDQETYHEVATEVSDSITTETPTLAENNIMVAELTAGEASALEHNNQVVVEEDIVISASTTDDYGEETQELTAEEARQRKEEIKQWKRERLEAWEESIENEAETEPEYEWNLQAINAQELQEESTQNQQKIKVAVLDSGVDYVTGINLTGYVNLVEEEQEISPMFQDLTGHGTGIASIIAGNGENGIYGVNPNVELYSVKILDEKNTAPLSRVIQGIYWCVEHDMDIINMSFGTSTYSKALEQAVEDAYDAGLLMVGAAGNGSEEVEYPAAFEEVMAVAATDPEAEISEFSNTGEELDVAAPGEKIRVAGFFDGSLVTHGTSIAVPHVTGVASLLWEKDRTKSNEFIRQLINFSAKDISGTDECGLLDAGYAINAYDRFSQEFDETQVISERNIPKNTDLPETFEHVNEDEAYVEGRWGGTDHKAAVDSGASGFSTEAINIIKQGAVYPDTKASDWVSGQVHSEWHGKWELFDKKYDLAKTNKEKYEINYIAVLEMVTEIATEGGNIKSYMTADYFSGLGPKPYNKIKEDINKLKTKYASILSNNTAENRKYFLYGCGLHVITDAFAHSTAKSNKHIIAHSVSNGGKPDIIDYYPKRYKTAVKVTQYALQSLKDDIYSNGEEVQKALREVYTADATFKIINLKKYMNANGYSGEVINRANINATDVIFE